ncbi:MAG: ribosome maturation factor RimP, partial [Alphaproteobacteria bacterium]|nr:ribosome maturation factor RimP [Alphaproteobacteria bacterium]
MAVSDRIAELISPTLESMGYELVRVHISGGRNNQTLQIMAERQDGKAVTVDDCETISHTVSAQLDVADPIASAYSLEVSSPGIDRPLTRLKDYQRFAGFEAKLQLVQPVDGRRNFRGILRGVEGKDISIEIVPEKKGASGAKVKLPFSTIDQAKLVMTDALLKATQEKQTGKQQEAETQ